tara:strand:+ start:389 stop:1216 length:828 start_codon:yes stop_codon:yes gene_type:complete
MNILVTGCNGFLGKEIKDFFSDKHNLFLTNRQSLNVLDEKQVSFYLEKNNIDAVIHTAVSGCGRETDTYNDFSNNISMFKNLYNNRDKFKIMINFGSGAEFNRQQNIFQKSEEEIFDCLPEDYYGLAKNMITREILKTDNIYNFRIFGSFGIHEKSTRFIKNSLRRLSENKPIHIIQNRHMDFIYVKDICLAIEYYLQNFDKKQLHKDINMCYNDQITLLDIANKILSIKNLPPSLVEVENKVKGGSYSGNGTRLKKINIHMYGLEKGLGEIINV